eukprot:jgi/Chlat1/2196/Chrsp17S08749
MWPACGAGSSWRRVDVCLAASLSRRTAALRGRRHAAAAAGAKSGRQTVMAAATKEPGDVKLGFLGMGIMGTRMAKNLLKDGYDVAVWSRNAANCEDLHKAGAQVAGTPKEITSSCDITFAMLADPAAALAVATAKACGYISKQDGAVAGLADGRGYVDASTVDVATAKAIAATVAAAGGRYLEAPVSGSKKPAEDGALIFLTAGDQSLHQDCLRCFDVMGKACFYLGDVGAGAQMKLVLNMIMGSMMAAFAEGLALGEAVGLDQKAILEVIASGTAIRSPMFDLKGPAMLSRQYPTAFPLKHQQKDLRLAIALGDEVAQPLPVAAAANELYKQARAAGFSDADFSAVLEVVLKRMSENT